MYVGLFIKTEVDTSNWPTSILKKDTKNWPSLGLREVLHTRLNMFFVA